MRNLKRLLAMTLTVLMVVGCFAGTAFAESYEDVYDYVDAIDTLSNLNVIKGYGDGTFGPDDSVARWHMTLWISKLETGKVSDDDLLTIWRAEENYTDFTDVVVDQYIGAINYASDEGIVLGTSADTFDPTAGIMYQDALTMVVRALGYGSDAMNAGYPWKFINKANELGLTDGLTGIAYTDVLTRAETAQILYNALFAVDADGATYAADVFNLSTIVLTGTNSYKIVDTESIVKKGYVCFNVLNANGTINEAVTYHLPASAFASVINVDAIDNYVGASFQVASTDGYKSLDIIVANPYEVFDNSEISLGNSTTIKLDGVSYEAVTSYSSLYNTQGIKGNTPEIIAYGLFAAADANGEYKYDANYNALNAKGEIAAYYRPDITGSYAKPYVVLLDSGIYMPVDSLADTDAMWVASAGNTYKNLTAGGDFNAFAGNGYKSAIAFDDNNDGEYDRVFFNYQKFGKVTEYKNGVLKLDNGDALSAGKFYDANGKAIGTPSGYIRYSYNALAKAVTVYSTDYTVETGLVSAVSASTITIGGVQYTLGGDGALPGSEVNSRVNLPQDATLLGKRISFLAVGTKIYRFVNKYDNAGTHIVFDNLTGMTSAGFATALVYTQSTAASVITIATIDGYNYQNYILQADAWSLGNITEGIATGTLFKGNQDAYGYWHLVSVDPDEAETYYVGYRSVDSATIEFKNGIAVSDSAFYTFNGTAKFFNKFQTKADTLYIVYDANTDRFHTTTGKALSGSTIVIDNGGYIHVDGNFIYVYGGTWTGKTITTTWTPSVYDAVIYVDANTVNSVSVTNVIDGNSTILGQIYTYGKALDMKSGEYITVNALYNTRLEAGKFYTVQNGYIEGEIEVYTADSPVQEGFLVYTDEFASVIENTVGLDVELYSTTNIFKLSGHNVVLKDGKPQAQATGSYIDGGKYWDAYTPVYYYAEADADSRVILLISDAKTISVTGPYTAADCKTSVSGAADANYYKLSKADYELLTGAFNFYGREDALENVNTYDKWATFYKNGQEITGLEVVLTALNVDVAGNIYGLDLKTPVYSLAVRASEWHKTDISGNIVLKLMFNGTIYTINLNGLNLKGNPDHVEEPIANVLGNVTATLYDVDKFAIDVVHAADCACVINDDATGDEYEGEFLKIDDACVALTLAEDGIALGQDGNMDTGRIFLVGGPKTNDEIFYITIEAATDKTHDVSVHGHTTVSEALEMNKIAVYHDEFKFDVNGEAVIDIVGIWNKLRDFECSADDCDYVLENQAWGLDYYYTVKITRSASDEAFYLSEDNVTMAPSWDVTYNNDGDDTTATLNIQLDKDFTNFVTYWGADSANTTVAVSNQVKFGGLLYNGELYRLGSWGDGVAYNVSAKVDKGTRDWYYEAGTVTFTTNSGTYNSAQIFDQVMYKGATLEIEKNFKITWSGTQYWSNSGTYDYDKFSVTYVLPFATTDFVEFPEIDDDFVAKVIKLFIEKLDEIGIVEDEYLVDDSILA